MFPVFVIEGKVRPSLERSGFSHTGYDKAEVLNYGFLVSVQYTYVLYLVFITSGKKIGGKMVVIIMCHFSNEGHLSCCNIFSMLRMSTNFFLADSFAMRCSFTSFILIPSMRRVVQYKKTSSFWRDV